VTDSSEGGVVGAAVGVGVTVPVVVSTPVVTPGADTRVAATLFNQHVPNPQA
jgi:hypothetical protein